MNKVAVISAILEEPDKCQKEFNDTISLYKEIIKGRMGIPFDEHGMSVVCLVAIGDVDKVNSLTGKLGNIPYVSVKTSISKKELP